MHLYCTVHWVTTEPELRDQVTVGWASPPLKTVKQTSLFLVWCIFSGSLFSATGSDQRNMFPVHLTLSRSLQDTHIAWLHVRDTGRLLVWRQTPNEQRRKKYPWLCGCNLTRVLNFLLLPLYTSNPGDMSWAEVWFPLELAVIQEPVLGRGTWTEPTSAGSNRLAWMVMWHKPVQSEQRTVFKANQLSFSVLWPVCCVKCAVSERRHRLRKNPSFRQAWRERSR